MAYKILKQLIYKSNKSKEELLQMADVYYGAGRVSKDEYEDIISRLK